MGHPMQAHAYLRYGLNLVKPYCPYKRPIHIIPAKIFIACLATDAVHERGLVPGTHLSGCGFSMNGQHPGDFLRRRITSSPAWNPAENRCHVEGEKNYPEDWLKLLAFTKDGSIPMIPKHADAARIRYVFIMTGSGGGSPTCYGGNSGLRTSDQAPNCVSQGTDLRFSRWVVLFFNGAIQDQKKDCATGSQH